MLPAVVAGDASDGCGEKMKDGTSAAFFVVLFLHQLEFVFAHFEILYYRKMKLAVISTVAALVTLSSTTAFVPSKLQSSRNSVSCNVATEADVDTRTGKPTGTSFLPAETVERAKAGSPIEKAKMAKDATSAWVDVYEYARKIRDGEMTWEEVEKADLDTVSFCLLSF